MKNRGFEFDKSTYILEFPILKLVLPQILDQTDTFLQYVSELT